MRVGTQMHLPGQQNRKNDMPGMKGAETGNYDQVFRKWGNDCNDSRGESLHR